MNLKYINFKEKYKNKKVVIMGLGLHGGGVGSAKFFSDLGANVLVTDLKTEKELEPSIQKLKDCKNIEYVLGNHRESDFINADLIIKNPGVRNTSTYLKIAIDNNRDIDTDIGIFFELCENKIIGITGTKGKSTTTKLITECLNKKYKVVTGGNYRISVLEMLNDLKEDNIVVLELSSWQLEGLEKHKASPHISVLTNLFEDHLNTYNNSMQEYADAKSLIFKFQNSEDYRIVNSDNENIEKYFDFKNLKAKGIYFGTNRVYDNSTIQNENFVFNGEVITNINNFKLQGKHNLENVLAAISVAKIMEIDNKDIETALLEFKTLEGRQELIRELNGIKFINDTTATSPIGVIQALNSIKSNIILIAGGVDKNLDYKELGELIVNKYKNKEIKHLILFKNEFTTATNKLLDIIKDQIEYEFAASMEEAVAKAYKVAEKGDFVLLSPSGASFGMFQHEFDRGEKFNNEVKKLI